MLLKAFSHDPMPVQCKSRAHVVHAKDAAARLRICAQLVFVTFFRCGGLSGSLPRARARASTIG